MKKIFLLSLLWGLKAGMCGDGRVTFLHTNDLHTQYLPMEATWVNTDPKPEIGGMVALEYFIRQQKTLFPDAIVVDAGDFMTGTPLSTYLYKGVRGGGFVEMMNRVGYDAVTLGNHEFDEGKQNLFDLLPLFDARIVSANLFHNDSLVAPAAYTIFTKDNVRVGIIGVMLSDLFQVAARSKLRDITVSEPVATVQKIVGRIDPVTDLIVLLTHQGHNDDIKLADELFNVDAIIGGHSHYRIKDPIVTSNVVIVQAGSKGRYVGRLTLDVRADSISNYEYELVPVWVDSVQGPDPALSGLVDRLRGDINREYRRVLGTLKNGWKRHTYRESNIGQFITGALRETCGTDFALINSGGIRKDKPAGQVSKLDVVEILPFTNYVVTFSCTGAQVLKILQNNLEAQLAEDYGILQMSGIHARYKVENGKIHLMSVKINGEPLDHEAIYSGASVDFIIIDQREHFLQFDPLRVDMADQLIADLVIEYIKAHPEIDGRLEQRIIKVD